MKINGTVLCFNFEDEKYKKIEKVCAKAKMRARRPALEDYSKPVGELVGFSGGGMQTLWLSALDDRIGFCAISGYMYGYLDSLLKLNGNCSCNYVPGLWLHADMGDIGALIAPRPVMIQSCREDHLNGERGLSNVLEQVEIMREAYRLFGLEDRILHDVREGDHCWHGEPLEAFMEKAERELVDHEYI